MEPRLTSRVFLLASLSLSMVLSGHAQIAQPCCAQHTFIGNSPDEGNPGWHQEAQGLTHDADYWTSRRTQLSGQLHQRDPAPAGASLSRPICRAASIAAPAVCRAWSCARRHCSGPDTTITAIWISTSSMVRAIS